MANCDNRCPVYRQIAEIRERCLACNVCAEGNAMQVGGGGVVYADGAENPESVYLHRLRDDRGDADAPPSPGVTALPLEIEDTLREMFSTFTGLDPISQLLLTHLARGGNLADFHEHLRKVTGQMQKIINQRQQVVKTFAWTRFKGVAKAFKPFAAIAGGLIGKGKGGAVLGGRGKGRYQSEFDFG